MLSSSASARTFRDNVLLSTSTALTAGMTNVAGVMACYAFTSNVTGHTAAFAQHMLRANWFEMIITITWILLFMLGAFTAHFLIRSFADRSAHFAHSLPIIIEAILLLSIGIYGVQYHNETEVETTIITCILLFGMGLQNSAVSLISGSGIKTSHLTGLLTDLGADVSEWLHPKTPRPESLKKKLHLRFSILFCYIAGAFIGGWLFINFSFTTFSIIAAILTLIIVYDFSKIHSDKNAR